MEWNFPSTNNGQIRGIADAGIMTFQGDGIKALTRETCQNSLDAKAKDQKTVLVEFKQYAVDTQKIPGYIKYKSMLKTSLNYWKGNSEKGEKFLEAAIDSLNQKETIILRISDFNTTGLLEPYKMGFGSWNALTKIDGGATKSGDSAGSFGIGKSAPYMCSGCRMVFYRTFNEDGERAAQGMSRLPSYQENEDNYVTTGIGYYGNSENNGPVESIPELESLYKRNDIGTDIFIYGLNVINTKDIKKSIYQEALDNFLISIYKGLLQIKFAEDIIDENTLEKFINQYKVGIKDSYCTWMALSKPEAKEFKQEFHGLGYLKLTLLVDHSEKLNHKILVTRKSGMKLFYMKNISKTISHTGVLELEGEALNSFFREMETPAHDKWKPKNHDNVELAEEYLKELKDWVTEKVNELGAQDYSDEVVVSGLGSVLSDTAEESADLEKTEGLNDFLNKIDTIELDNQTKTMGYYYPENGSEANTDNRNLDKKKGNIDKNGSYNAARTLAGNRQRKKKENHKGNINVDGKDFIVGYNERGKQYLLRDVRIMSLGTGNYRVSYIVPKDIDSGYVELVTVGENGRKVKINIVQAKEINNCENVVATKGEISFSKMKGNVKVQLEFKVPESRTYAMEVKVYEYNK